MSFLFFMYRGPDGLTPVTEWERSLGEPIGSRAEVCAALSQLLPSIEWGRHDERSVHGWGVDAKYDMPFSISADDDDSGVVSLILTNNRASPSTLASIMDRFKLDFCYTDYGERRYPHACDDDWKPVQ